jgi:hypothetical protein
MSAFTSAAQGDNCCGQRKNSFNLPKTFHDLCSLECGLVEVESTRIRKGLQEALWYCSSPASPTNGDHTLPVIPQAASTWQSYHAEVDYEKQYQNVTGYIEPTPAIPSRDTLSTTMMAPTT